MNDQELAVANKKLEEIRKELEARTAELGFDPVKALDYASMLADAQHLRDGDHQDPIVELCHLLDVKTIEFRMALSWYEKEDQEFLLTAAGVDLDQVEKEVPQ